MIIIAVVVLAAAVYFAIYIHRRKRQEKLPEYLRGKKFDRYEDLITSREVYVASFKDPEKRAFVHEAFFAEDGRTCTRALIRNVYGFMYYGDGILRMVPKSISLKFLQALKEGKNPSFLFKENGEEKGEGNGED